MEQFGTLTRCYTSQSNNGLIPDPVRQARSDGSGG